MESTTTTFNDIFKDNFLSGFSLTSQNLTLGNILVSLGIAFLLGLFIFFIYKKTYRGVLYSHSFNLSLIMLSMVTSLVIMCITSAPALSLGMVGALSIVRFRTAVKDPMDTVYMFWAIAVGITVGANFILFSIVGTLVIAVLMLILSFTGEATANNYLMVIHYEPYGANDMNSYISKLPFRNKIKSKTVTKNGIELTLECRIPKNNTKVVDNLMKLPYVKDATLVAFKNEIA